MIVLSAHQEYKCNSHCITISDIFFSSLIKNLEAFPQSINLEKLYTPHRKSIFYKNFGKESTWIPVQDIFSPFRSKPTTQPTDESTDYKNPTH